MATLERTMANIVDLLDAAGVTETDELQAQGYRIGARALFVEAAARGLRSKPRKSWKDEDVVAKARLFVLTMPRTYARDTDESYAMPSGEYLVQNRWFTGLNLAPRASSFSNRMVRPSVTQEGVVTEHVAEYDHGGLRGRAEAIAHEAAVLMRRIMGPILGEESVRVHRANPHGYTFSLHLASGMPWTRDVANEKLHHDADVRLLAPFVAFAEAMVLGESDLAEFDNREAVQTELDDIAAGTGLPIALRLAAGQRTDGKWAARHLTILMDGYGAGGRRETQVVRPINIDMDVKSIRAALSHDDKIRRQRQLHADHGPVPRVEAVPLYMDAPSARRLAQTGRGSDIARALSLGLPGDGGEAGVAFRFKGDRVLGTFEVAPGVIWKGDRIDVQMTKISDVMAAALPGRSLRDVVSHPTLGEDDLVRRVEQRASKTANTLVVHASPRMVPIGDIDALAAQPETRC